MKGRARIGWRVGFLAASSMVLFGCPNPNTYTTPRTIGWGHVQGSAAAEFWGFYRPASTIPGGPQASSGMIPTAPSFMLRVGLGDSWEIGARVANLSSAGGDVKWNFLKSSRIDLALDPACQIFKVDGSDSDTNETFTFLHVPLLVGVNLSPRVTLLFTPGASWGFASAGPVRFKDGPDQGTTSGTVARFGLGIDYRIAPNFAMHPEITFIRTLNGDPTIFYVAGIGFNFGAMPHYDDVGAGPPPVAPPPEDHPP